MLGDDDPTTRRLMEELLAKEEEHADELAMLLEPTRRGRAGADRKPVAVEPPAALPTAISRGRGAS